MTNGNLHFSPEGPTASSDPGVPSWHLPSIVAHADWGSDPRKRWVAVAEAVTPGGAAEARRLYLARAPSKVGDLSRFLADLSDRAKGGGALVGLDFPIGLPLAYAERVGISDFVPALPLFGTAEWSRFYEVASRADEIELRRPFYPRRPGGTKHRDLLDALEMPDMNALRRQCEHKTAQRNAAAPLFWTLGGQQVGRAAIVGWRDLLAPGLLDPGLDLRIWPFDGDLATLLGPGRVVVAETYPAEACVHIGLPPPGRGWSKRSEADRKAQATTLTQWAGLRGLRLSAGLRDAIGSGFGPAREGEDPFDATVGLFGMLEVLLGHRAAVPQMTSVARRVEGWILGQGGSAPD